MFKLAAIVSLMLIATWSHADSRRHKKDASETRDFHTGSTMWAASLSCDSCGSECTSACGTRHFRSCCFNYLRRKRAPDAADKLSPQNAHEKLQDFQPKESKFPIFVVDNAADQWLSNLPEYRPYDDLYDNALFEV